MSVATRQLRGLRGRFRGMLYSLRFRWHGLAFRLLLPANQHDTAEQWVLPCFNNFSIPRNTAVALMVRQLIAKGWHAKFPYRGIWYDALIAGNADDGISGKLRLGATLRYCTLVGETSNPADWAIDIPARRIVADGINFFAVVENSIDNERKASNSDLAAPENKSLFDRTMATVRDTLVVARRIRDAAAAGKKITLIMDEMHTAPNAVLFEYLTSPRHMGSVTIYLLCEAYSRYSSENFAAADFQMTRVTSPEVVSPFYLTSEVFEPWYAGLDDEAHDHIRESVMPLITSTRVRNLANANPDIEAERRIHEARASGRPVYCLFSHLTYDRYVHEGTAVFDGMADWVTKTVEAFRSIDGLLLVKPHVWERAFEGSPHLPNQTMADIFATLDAPDNVILLRPDHLLAHETIPLIDAAIIWRSTAYPEMMILGKPAIFCCANSFYKHPLQLSSPVTFGEYLELLRQLPKHAPTIDMARRAAAVLYLAHQASIIPLALLSQMPFQPKGETKNYMISPWRLAECLLLGRHQCPEGGNVVETGMPMGYRLKNPLFTPSLKDK
jgi:hypothetical protein